MPDNLRNSFIVRSYVNRLKTLKPVTADAVESFLLRLNDLPGVSLRSVLSPVEDTKDGAVKLELVSTEKAGKGSISFDIPPSRYLGPHEITTSYTTSLLPLQQTTLSGLTAVPKSNVRYGALDHTITLAPDFSLDLNGGLDPGISRLHA